MAASHLIPSKRFFAKAHRTREFNLPNSETEPTLLCASRVDLSASQAQETWPAQTHALSDTYIYPDAVLAPAQLRPPALDSAKRRLNREAFPSHHIQCQSPSPHLALFFFLTVITT